MRSRGSPERRVVFERHPSRVVFSPDLSLFVVTWTKCDVAPEIRRDVMKNPVRWMPSVSAVADLYDRGCIDEDQLEGAARSIGRAFDAGDRSGLDTEEARKAAAMVGMLSSMPEGLKPGAKDLGQAMRRLVDEMAAVRFSETPQEEFGDEALGPLEEALGFCMSLDGFSSWPPHSMRRRMLFRLNKSGRTSVVYTLLALLFGTGSCPLLSMGDRRALRLDALRASGMSSGMTVDTAMDFLRHSLGAMRRAKAAGMRSPVPAMSTIRLSESVSQSSPDPLARDGLNT